MIGLQMNCRSGVNFSTGNEQQEGPAVGFARETGGPFQQVSAESHKRVREFQGRKVHLFDYMVPVVKYLLFSIVVAGRKLSLLITILQSFWPPGDSRCDAICADRFLPLSLLYQMGCLNSSWDKRAMGRGNDPF